MILIGGKIGPQEGGGLGGTRRDGAIGIVDQTLKIVITDLVSGGDDIGGVEIAPRFIRPQRAASFIEATNV